MLWKILKKRMDKIFKFLQKRNKDERLKLLAVIRLISENNLENLDIKKLKGSENIFRVRVGRFRVIFEKSKKENIICSIAKRDDQTYQ